VMSINALLEKMIVKLITNWGDIYVCETKSRNMGN
jgi:hypothetical protein